jgi:hypothetical protein
MNERWTIFVVVTVFLILEGIAIYFSLMEHDFTFYQAKISANEMKITETLKYVPENNLHTLYRNFDSPFVVQQYVGKESIKILNVKCSDGKPYAKLSQCLNFSSGNYNLPCLDYTEDNEYGCSFGNERGFIKDKDYEISATYNISTPIFFKYNGEIYAKFIAYDSKKHPLLVKGDNFIAEGVISADRYFPFDNVIMYVPYSGNIKGDNIKEVDSLDFGTDHLKLFFFSFLPIFIIFFTWFLFCRKINVDNIPEELSEIPEKIKPWEVTVLERCIGNAVSATIFDFYRRKIIDIKPSEKKSFFNQYQTYIKFLKDDSNLDELEKKVYKILKISESIDNKKEGGYFELNNSDMGFKNFSKRNEMNKEGRNVYQSLSASQNKISPLLPPVLGVCILLFLFIFIINISPILYYIYFFAAFVIILLSTTMGLFIQFKPAENYTRYIQWKSFKRFLKNSYSMKASDVKGVIIWNEYLVYASALGVSKIVLKRLRKEGIITDKQYNSYSSFIIATNSFSSASGSGGAGGGSAGGGGAGGGGGGGR